MCMHTRDDPALAPCTCTHYHLTIPPTPPHKPHPTNHTQGECRQWKLRFAANLHARAKDELERLTEYIRVCARAFVFF